MRALTLPASRSLSAATPERIRALVIEPLGAVLFIVALASTWRAIHDGIGIYDEGILLTDAYLLMMGKVPYRDFYANYPPGSFGLLAFLFGVFGKSVFVERALGLVVHALMALGAGRLVGRIRGGMFSFACAGIVATWLAWLALAPYAWLMAMTVALWAANACLWAVERAKPKAYALAGFAVASVSWFRHDLFAYWAVFSALFGGAYVLWRWRWRSDSLPLRVAGWFSAGVAVGLVVFWPAVFIAGGFRQVLNDLYFDQVKYVLPGRTLPFPSFKQWSHLVAAILLTFAGPVLGVLAAVAPRTSGVLRLLGVTLMTTLALAAAPQMMGRTDAHHAIYTVTPAIILGMVWAYGGTLGTGRGLADAWFRTVVIIAVLLGPAIEHLNREERKVWTPAFPSLPHANTVIDGEAGARRQVLDYIAANTRPGEPIYVGLTSHRTVFISEMDMYFLAERPGSTRVMQFDPNVGNREDAQRAAIEQLERANTKIFILSARGSYSGEQNDSIKPGSGMMDEYLERNTQLVFQAGVYVVRSKK